MTTTHSPSIDAGRRIAIAYWHDVHHVASVGYPDKTYCALCEVEVDHPGYHKLATERPHPTVAEVLPRDARRQSYELRPSCGHRSDVWSNHSISKRLPRVGEPFSTCWTCDEEWQELNHPGLPQEIIDKINAKIPHCPQCGDVVKFIPYVQHCEYDIYFEVDGQTGATESEAGHYDTLDVVPVSSHPAIPLPDGWWSAVINVSCENRHDWRTDRLSYKQEGSKYLWRVEPR